MAVWNAYQPTANGVRTVTVLFGADGSVRACRGVVHAIFASARFD